MNEIRQLVENYYDIQKIRVETFNRIVMFIKENEKKIIEALSQVYDETHESFASHTEREIQHNTANHREIEPHSEVASHQNVEAQYMSASYLDVENHSENVSHVERETHVKIAFKLLKEKKYSEFVKKYIISQVESETHPHSASHGRYEFHSANASHEDPETNMLGANQEGFETHTSNVSQGESETQLIFALSPFLKQIENLIWFHNKLYETEKELYKRLDAWSRNHPLRTEYLNYVKGIGAVLSSGIIAWLEEPIKKANHVSQIWSYCGLAPNQVRKAGEKVNYNPKLKTFAWKIGESFIKFKCFGRKLYDNFKEEAKQKHPDWTKLHIHNYARRKVVKLFIASVWEVWRKMNNLPVTKPYPIDFLGHKDIITPEMWMEKRSE